MKKPFTCAGLLAAVSAVFVLSGCAAGDAPQSSAAATAAATTTTAAATVQAAEPALSFEQVRFPSGTHESCMSSSMALVGTTLEKYYEVADAVVIADVIKDDHPDYTGYDPILECFSTIRVLQTYKGDARPSDEILIEETGSRRSDIFEFSLDGVPLLRSGMRVLLFLYPHTTLANGEPGRTIVGAYQGKLFFDAAGAIYESAALGSDSSPSMNLPAMNYVRMNARLRSLQQQAFPF